MDLSVGPLLCIAAGATTDERGQRALHAPSCATLVHEPACGGDSRRTRPHHARAVEMTREGDPLIVT
jgi:hypothetical protein